MKSLLLPYMFVFAGFLAGCDKAAVPPVPEPTAEMSDSSTGDSIPMTELPALKIGAFDVQPMYEEELKDGHFNIKIAGGEVAAVREWVGPEDASGVVVVKTEIENDYHHGHVEMPEPLPADARLWIEIETPDGTRLKGSTPLAP